MPDSIVTNVIEKIENRAKIGFEKYGVTMDRDDLSLIQWIEHAQEEMMDMLIYLEKIKQVTNSKST
jgi:hypothetical protein